MPEKVSEFVDRLNALFDEAAEQGVDIWGWDSGEIMVSCKEMAGDVAVQPVIGGKHDARKA